MTRPVLAAQRREITGKDVARLRRQGILPAVLYGHGEASEAIQVDAKAFEAMSRAAGRHALIDLKVDGERTHQAVVHGVQEHPVRRTPLHVDFYLVRMTEEMTMDVTLVPVGVSLAVEKHSGTLLQTLEHVRLRGLPGAMPQVIEYDVSALDSFEAVIRVRDLPIPRRSRSSRTSTRRWRTSSRRAPRSSARLRRPPSPRRRARRPRRRRRDRFVRTGGRDPCTCR